MEEENSNNNNSVWRGLLPKEETQALQFIQENPQFDGKGVIVGLFDTGVDPGAAGLLKTSHGEPKVIDIIDCSGSGDILMNPPIPCNPDGITLTSFGVRILKINPNWKNPTGMYRIGLKRAFEFFPKDLIVRLREARKKDFEKEYRVLESKMQKRLLEVKPTATNGTTSTATTTGTAIEILEDAKTRIAQLRLLEKDFEDPGPVYDVIVFHDGERYQAAMDCSETGDFSDISPMTDYRVYRQYATFSNLDSLNYCVNIYDDGSVLSIVVDSGAHGTHVAGIVSAHHADQPECNGVAPGAQIISLKIGDSRLGSMETGVGLMRGLIEAVKRGVHIINMSYGEATSWCNTGAFGKLTDEIVKKYGIIFVASAGNNGPALSTVGCPGGTTASCIGVGALVTKSLMSSAYSTITTELPEVSYQWSSLGPTLDGALGVSVIAPGGAITCVPNWTLNKKQLMNGTSMSAPHASGCIALLMSAALASAAASASNVDSDCVDNDSNSGSSSCGITTGVRRSIDHGNGANGATSISTDSTPTTITNKKRIFAPPTPVSIRRAIENSANILSNVHILGQGNGLIQVKDAWQLLQAESDNPYKDINFLIKANHTNFSNGIYLRQPHESNTANTYTVNIDPEFPVNCPSEIKFQFEMRLLLETTADWITVPKHVLMLQSGKQVSVYIDPRNLPVGTVNVEFINAYDTARPYIHGPVFRIPLTVIRPEIMPEGSLMYDLGTLILETDDRTRRFIVPPRGCTYIDLRLIDPRLPSRSSGVSGGEGVSGVVSSSGSGVGVSSTTSSTSGGSVVSGSSGVKSLSSSATKATATTSTTSATASVTKVAKLATKSVVKGSNASVITKDEIDQIIDNPDNVTENMSSSGSGDNISGGSGNIESIHDGGRNDSNGTPNSTELDDGGRMIVVHTLQVFRGTPYRDNEFHKYLTLTPSSEHVISFAVHEEVTLEVVIGRAWACIGDTVCQVELFFRGVQPSPSQLFISGGQRVSPMIRISSPLSSYDISPVGKLEKWVSVLKPNPVTSKISTLGERDILPDGRPVYQLLLEYEIDLLEGYEVVCRWPGLQLILYESNFLGQFFMLYDWKKRVVGSGDAWPKSVKLSKGKHTIRLQVRHTSTLILVSLQDMPCHFDRPMKNPIPLSFFQSQTDTLIGIEKMNTRNVPIGNSISFYLKEPTQDALPKSCLPGDVLSGSVSYIKKGVNSIGNNDRPKGYAVKYTVADTKIVVKPVVAAAATSSTSSAVTEVVTNTVVPIVTDSTVDNDTDKIATDGNDSNNSTETPSESTIAASTTAIAAAATVTTPAAGAVIDKELEILLKDAKIKHLKNQLGNEVTFRKTLDHILIEYPEEMVVKQIVLSHYDKLLGNLVYKAFKYKQQLNDPNYSNVNSYNSSSTTTNSTTATTATSDANINISSNSVDSKKQSLLQEISSTLANGIQITKYLCIAADIIVNKIDTNEIAREIGMNVDKENPVAVAYRKEIDGKKTSLTDALHSKAKAILQCIKFTEELLSIQQQQQQPLVLSDNGDSTTSNEESAVAVATAESSGTATSIINTSSTTSTSSTVTSITATSLTELKSKFTTAYKELQKWEEISTIADKYASLLIARYQLNGYYGLALKRITDWINATDSKLTVANREMLYQEKLELMEKLEMTNFVTLTRKWSLLASKDLYEAF